MVENKPLVTCITPTYGRFNLLEEMVWCWQNQDYPNKELVIVNDQKNLTITVDDPRIKVINLEERLALGAKRNIAIQNSHEDAEFICPFDDDDLFFPEHISFLVSLFGDNPYLDRTKNIKHFVSIDGNHFNISHDAGPTYFGASCFRKKIFVDHPLKDYMVMGEDADLFERKKMNMKVEQNPLISSFIYRRGMGIPHASLLKAFSYSENIQQEILEGMDAAITPYSKPTTEKINPRLSLGKNLYNRIEEYRNQNRINK